MTFRSLRKRAVELTADHSVTTAEAQEILNGIFGSITDFDFPNIGLYTMPPMVVVTAAESMSLPSKEGCTLTMITKPAK